MWKLISKNGKTEILNTETNTVLDKVQSVDFVHKVGSQPYLLVTLIDVEAETEVDKEDCKQYVGGVTRYTI